jgi:hypothetical protein
MKCPSCSEENKEGNRFCAMCGSKLQLTCPGFGLPSNPNLNFCGGCGARLQDARAMDEVRPPKPTVELADRWVSEFEAIGWGRELFWERIRKELSNDIQPRDGEGVIFAGKSSLDLHLFLHGIDGGDMIPVAGFIGTNFRLIILAPKMDGRRLDPLVQIDYKELAGIKELEGAEASKDMRELEGILRISLQGRNDPVDLLVLNKKARTPLLAFLQVASSRPITAPTGSPQPTLEPVAVEGEARKTQDASRAVKREEPAAHRVFGGEKKKPSQPRQQSTGMKWAAAILGILGGVAGAIGAVVAIVVGGIGSAFGAEGAESISALGIAALVLAIAGTVGGAIAVPKPKIAAVLMLISGIGGIIAVFAAYVFGGALLIIGGVLALLALRQPKSAEIRA